MSGFLYSFALSVALVASGQAAAQTLVGVAAPMSGPSAILGRQVRAGAEAAAGLLPGTSILVRDDACTADGGRSAAQAFVAAKVVAAVGFLCTEAIEAAMPVLTDAGIPVVTVGVRTDSLTDGRQKTRWDIYRLAPRGDAEQAAIAQLLPKLWRDELFAIVDDGTIYGRELAESARAAVEQAGLKAVFVDTFRPQSENQIGLVGRLRRAGATHVFVGGDREDIAIMARDAAVLGAPLTILGGEALVASSGEVPLAAGVLMIGPPAPLPDDAVEAAFGARGVAVEGYVLPSFAAIQIVAQAAAGLSAGQAPSFGERSFDTAIGPVSFDGKGDLAANPYRLMRFDGTRFVEVPAP